jgi:hypothetical protein
MCMNLATCCYGFSFSVFFCLSQARNTYIYMVRHCKRMLIRLRERTDANPSLTGLVDLGR